MITKSIFSPGLSPVKISLVKIPEYDWVSVAVNSTASPSLRITSNLIVSCFPDASRS